MTPTPTDLKNAKEFVDNKSDIEVYTYVSELPELLVQYLLHEVAAGRVKFTANREGI